MVFKIYLRMLKFLLFTVMTIKLAQAQSSCETNRLNAVKNGTQGVRGTNLGSWFVLESWMANKPWDDNNCSKSNGGCYLLEKCLGNRAPEVMEKHWSTWITENDFIEMSQRGVNLARLPVGWWHIYDTEGGADNANLNWYVTPRNFTTGGLKYIDKAFDWGKKHGIAILLDLHAAPGSQNGNEHSSPANPGVINWPKYPANVGQSVDSMGLYAERYANHSALYGFCLLNEPSSIDIDILQDYYERAYKSIRQHSKDSYIIINPLIGGPFEYGTETHWINFMNPEDGYTKVGMDLHYYSCFGGSGDKTDADDAISYIRNDRKGQITEYKNKNPKGMIIGEWSACGHFDVSRAGEFAQAQVDVYSTTTYGWTFWSWTDGSKNNRWSLKTAFNQGWISEQHPC